MGFYERLENLRKEAGIGQGKLEKELQIANGSISKWKNRTPKYSTLVKISDFFNVSVEYLINGKDDDNTNDKPDYIVNIDGINVIIETVNVEDNKKIVANRLKYIIELLKQIGQMKDDDIKFLLDTATRITHNEEPDNIVPFPQYPNVTNKEINEFAARNAKRKFTREEIAEMIYEMRKDD